jgi:hypothetical protein
MTSKTMSVREARMALQFAIFGGNKERIAEAEQQLQEALMKAAQQRGKTTFNDSPRRDDTSSR